MLVMDRCDIRTVAEVPKILSDYNNALPLLTKGAMRYGYALVNASHIAYCVLHIA